VNKLSEGNEGKERRVGTGGQERGEVTGDRVEGKVKGKAKKEEEKTTTESEDQVTTRWVIGDGVQGTGWETENRLRADSNHLPRLERFETFQAARHQRKQIFEKNRFSAEHYQPDLATA